MTNPLAFVRDTCGRVIRLDVFESVAGLRTTETTITLAVNRAKSKPRRGMAWQVTKRGTTLYTFTKSESGWDLTDTFTVWHDTDELHEPAPSS